MEPATTRRRIVTRAISFVIAAALIMVVMSSAGLFPDASWVALQDRFASAEPPVRDGKAPLSTPVVVEASPANPVGAAHDSKSDAVLPAAPRRLILVSTSPGRHSGEGTARIGTDPEHPQTYVAGASIANGARLAEVHSDHVVLERDGKTFELYIPSARPSRGDASVATLGGPPPVPPAKVTMVDDRLSGVIRSTPVYDGVALVGLQVFAGQRAGLFSQLGLRSGDVIVALDGSPVADADTALDALRSLADGAALTANVRRNGSMTTIALDGAVLATASGASMGPFTGAMNQ